MCADEEIQERVLVTDPRISVSSSQTLVYSAKVHSLSSWSGAKDLVVEQFSGIRSFASLQDDKCLRHIGTSSAANVLFLFAFLRVFVFHLHPADVGGFSGQSRASRSSSIWIWLNSRLPRSIPGHFFDARSQAWRLARFPCQKGHVLH